MQEILINSSVVLVTLDPIPSVNHDFLVNKQIIPKDFQTTQHFLNTPVVSQVDYKNGFNITIEPNKALFQLSRPYTNEQDSLKSLSVLQDISSKYIKVFEYLKYQAIGINFKFIKDDVMYDSIIKQVVKPESPYLMLENNKGAVNNISVSYTVQGKVFNVYLNKMQKKSPAQNNQKSKESFVPLFDINIHYSNKYTNNPENIVAEIKANYQQALQFIRRFS